MIFFSLWKIGIFDCFLNLIDRVDSLVHDADLWQESINSAGVIDSVCFACDGRWVLEIKANYISIRNGKKKFSYLLVLWIRTSQRSWGLCCWGFLQLVEPLRMLQFRHVSGHRWSHTLICNVHKVSFMIEQ